MHIAIANGLPSTGKIRRLESSIDNGGLEEEMWRGEAPETIGLASIFGGASLC